MKILTVTKKSLIFYISLVMFLGLWSCKDDNKIVPTPAITKIAPISGLVGSTVTITGTNFSTVAADNLVSFNGIAATVTEATSRSLTTTVPVGATTGKVTVTTNNQTSAGFLFTVAIPLQIQSSYPPEGSKNIKLYVSFVLNFSEDVEVLADNFITIQPKKAEGYHIVEVSTNNLDVEGNTITFPKLAVIGTIGETFPAVMRYGTETEMRVSKGVIVGKNSRRTMQGTILTFTTQALPEIGHIVRSSNEFDGIINWNSISDFHKTQIQEAHTRHKLSAASGESLTGKGVKVGIVDIGIAKGSEVYSSVVYSSVNLDDPFLADFDPNTWYNHGTQMARYLLDYAPKTDIFNLHKDKLDFSSSGGQIVDLLQMIEDQNIDIVSLSGSGLDSDEEENTKLHALIQKNVVLSRSLGNDDWIFNIPSSYKHKQMFFPYLYDLTNAQGAFVCLQAVSPLGNDYETVRSQAGSAKHYTLSIIETGVGATSQATASFSGIMALMLEAAKKYQISRTPKELVEILMQTAQDIGDPGVDKLYGHGLINIEAALNYLKSGIAPTFKLYENMDADFAIML